MALDGIYLHHIRQELEQAISGARVDKIYQPNREELVFTLRTLQESYRLLLSARANSARIALTAYTPENPKQPPMFCMLLRKRLGSARLAAVRQPELERVLFLEFDAVNEMGDHIQQTIAVEIMGRYSNLILIDEKNDVVDALKRVDASMTSARLVLPGIPYELPPKQEKLCLLQAAPEELIARMQALPKDMELSKAVLSVLQGASPVVCREAEFFCGRGREVFLRTMTEDQKERLCYFLGNLRKMTIEASGVPYLIEKPGSKPLDFSFMNIQQYGTAAVVSRKKSFSEVLDLFFEERDRIDRMRAREQDLLRLLTNATDRLSRKINLQRAELEQCAERDYFRICGDLITANQHTIGKGASRAELVNYYEEELPIVSVKLNPALSAAQNAQKYYKEYRKARTAEGILTKQIAQAQEELQYIDTVFDALSRAQTENDLAEIRAELREQGYLRAAPKGNRKNAAGKLPKSEPLRFLTSDGFTVLVGRNNRNNDELTLKRAKKEDIWLHTKGIPGSHTILQTEGREPTETAIYEAACLAAQHSKGKASAQVPVDYTRVRYVSKPQGAKPGQVIYVRYKTLYVTPGARQKDGPAS